jgi:lauroyl/myristoyl acyltransferase
MERGRYFRELLAGNLDDRELRTRVQRYLFHLSLSKELETAWRQWGHRQQDWIAIEGEPYLRAALQQGKGAFLVSPHNFGFSKLVAPVLAARGYRVHRGGNGGERGAKKRTRWGDAQRAWGYLDYKGDYWQRAKTMKAMQAALAANDVVHVSPRAFREGQEEMAGEIFGHKFFLEATWFRLFDLCDAPVLPCFVVRGACMAMDIVIHAPLPEGPSRPKAFAALQSAYIEKFPEHGRMWKNLGVGKDRW